MDVCDLLMKDHAADALFPSYAERIAQADALYIRSKLEMQLEKLDLGLCDLLL